jgi:threonine/homoserine/homoserine lactone efflux protein
MQMSLLFLGAAFALAVAPGPGMLYVLARTLAGGRREGALSAFGTFLGGLVHVIAAAVGLSAILAASALAYSVVKYAGAAYLVYLGVRMIVAREEAAVVEPGARSPFWQGVATEVLNPKTAVFFLSFIPQFVDPARPAFSQFVLLGAVSVTLNTAADLVVVLFAGPIGQRLRGSARWRLRQRRATGAMLIGLGGAVALDSR